MFGSSNDQFKLSVDLMENLQQTLSEKDELISQLGRKVV
jgi:hypothetical protein